MRKFLALLSVALLAFPAMAATPKVWYDTDGVNVWRGEKNGREMTDIEPNKVFGSDYCWFVADSAVWLSNLGDNEAAPIWIPLKKGEICQEIEMDPEQTLVFLCLTTKKTETIAIFDLEGNRLAETPGVMGMGGYTLEWIDPYRCLFTYSVPGTQRGKRSGLWRGAAVMELFGKGGEDFEILVTPVAEPTATENYRAFGVAGDECVVIKYTVKSPKEWEQLDDGAEEAGQSEEIRIPVPAAG
ncbi:MAG: hypothetical protein K6E38_05795 [Fretibacterium sp.]|nr:hypothetical protein [Fretibacterium sp.]